jgi:hypothetical protein
MKMTAGAGTLAIAAIWMLLRFPPEQYGFYPACPFHAGTGLLCPGCGGTRAVAALLRGDLRAALGWNALIVGLLPFCAGYGFVAAWQRRWVQLPRGVWLGMGALTGAFGVLRNLI